MALPGVRRVGFALTEGGGRRLRFVASDRSRRRRVDWCHIDAYDDVPLTTVVRTGEPVLAARDPLTARYAEFVARQPAEVRALAAVPLPGIGSPIGGIMLFLDETWVFDAPQRRLLEATARRAADAVRRVRAGCPHRPEPSFAERGRRGTAPPGSARRRPARRSGWRAGSCASCSRSPTSPTTSPPPPSSASPSWSPTRSSTRAPLRAPRHPGRRP